MISLEQFDPCKRAFINPEDFVKPVEGFPEICVSTFSEKIIERFAKIEGVTVIANLYAANGVIPVYQMKYKETNIAFFMSRVSAPACVCGFEEVVAMGVKRFVLFGSCGVLDSEKTDGKMLIPNAAVRDEGTSFHYMAPSDEIEAEKNSVKTAAACMEECGYPYIEGKVWTTDAVYRETAARIKKRKGQGCLGVEMECAAMLAVSQFREIPYIQFLYPADNLDSDTWDARDINDHGLSSAEKYMLLAFECGIKLCE